MNISHPKAISLALATAIVFSSTGCLATIEHPTHASVQNRIHNGDDIEVVTRSGEKRKFRVTAINDQEIRAGYEAPVRYEDIEKIRLKRSAEGMETVGTVFAVVAAIPFIAGMLVLEGMARAANSVGHR